jgi:hypothetical protein
MRTFWTARLVQRRRLRSPLLRVRLLALGCIVGLALTAGVNAAPASASWSNTLEGVEFGWVNTYGRQAEYAWARASDATLAHLGASRATVLACRAVTEDVPLLTLACEHLVKPWVSSWINSEPRWTHHGHWVEFYPHKSPHLWYSSYECLASSPLALGSQPARPIVVRSAPHTT